MFGKTRIEVNRVVTMADVARRAGVSVMTVSRVVNGSGYVKESTRKRVLEAMEELNYVPRVQQLREAARPKTLVLIVPDITNPFFTFVARGTEDVARKHGYRVLLANTDENLEKEREYVQMCLDYQVEGVLIVPVGDHSADNLMLLSQREVPFVLIDREVEGVTADVVKGDITAASGRLVEHLIELGHRRIGIITGPLSNAASRERLEGYMEALRAAGLPYRDAWVRSASMTREMDVSCVEEMLALEDAPTALFVANMFQYAHTIRALHRLGIRVPEDLSLVSFGNTDDLASVDSILTAAIQPTYNFGSLGAQLLLERIDGVPRMPTRIVLNSQIIYRKSTAPPKR